MLNQNLEDLTTRTHNVNKEIAEILDKKEEIEDVIIDPAKVYYIFIYIYFKDGI